MKANLLVGVPEFGAFPSCPHAGPPTSPSNDSPLSESAFFFLSAIYECPNFSIISPTLSFFIIVILVV